ncbi:MAG: lysophospholipid acyltransferase family protein [Bacteroidales bacterium]|nr:lysophospholipid acyltransferase family protein [Bacteroidales bacterium]
MRFIGFILTYSFIWLLHLLPEKALFLCSDLLFLINYYVVGYRKKVVYGNLNKAFPELSQGEIRQIAKKYYRHLSDLILESAVIHFKSEKKATKRITYSNPELLNELYRKGKQVMAVTAHYGNWEYLSTLSLASDYPVIAIYKPLRNKYFDKMVTRNRTRFGVMVTPMERIARELIRYHNEQKPVLTIFLSDQRPMYQNIQYWTKFLGLDTPLYLGTEKLAKKLDAAVVFLKFNKISRGRYEVDIELICEEPGELEPFEITDSHVGILEKMIREAPEYWLWSHHRWKHSYERYLKETESRKSQAGS